ncbi:MAG: hypothetical protein KDD66_03270 [Bdellovibrionales bacterium]|nr:hypothetical protein [Bdellovibrionales bacterium]
MRNIGFFMALVLLPSTALANGIARGWFNPAPAGVSHCIYLADYGDGTHAGTACVADLTSEECESLEDDLSCS